MTQSAGSGGRDDYVLGRSDSETGRLILQHQIYGPITREFLIMAGITTGMKVLDVGSGAGDVAMMLAELVGPQGDVVGIDSNDAILDIARERVRATGRAQTSPSIPGICTISSLGSTSTLSSGAGS